MPPLPRAPPSPLRRVGVRRPLGVDSRGRRYWAFGNRAGAWRLFVESAEGPGSEAWGWYEGAHLAALLAWLKAGHQEKEAPLVKALEAMPMPKKLGAGARFGVGGKRSRGTREGGGSAGFAMPRKLGAGGCCWAGGETGQTSRRRRRRPPLPSPPSPSPPLEEGRRREATPMRNKLGAGEGAQGTRERRPLFACPGTCAAPPAASPCAPLCAWLCATHLPPAPRASACPRPQRRCRRRRCRCRPSRTTRRPARWRPGACRTWSGGGPTGTSCCRRRCSRGSSTR